MVSYIYNDEISKLLKGFPAIKKSDVYDYESSLISEEFEKLYQFFQENLRNECDEYEIQPSYFYYTEDSNINAFAWQFNSQFIIGINKGTIWELHKLFFQNDIFQNNINLKNYLSFEEILDVPISVLMYQLSAQFTYYHELGHLIQKSESLFQGIDEDYKIGFDQLSHLREFDADLHGANSIAFHVLQYWGNFEEEFKTQENIIKLISTGCASIFCYLTLLFRSFSKEIHYNENTHPHPLIRITYIVPTFIDVIAKHFTISQSEILIESIKISNEIFKYDGRDDLVGLYEKILFEEMPNIEKYIEHLINEADKLPSLVINKVHKKNSN